jgi:heme-degrading monooxygenase HmoA
VAREPYTHTTWIVKPGLEDAFVERWAEWVDWSRTEGFDAQALLLRDLDRPRTFISLGRWESIDAVRNWRGSAGYQARVTRLHEVLEGFDPHTLETVERLPHPG